MGSITEEMAKNRFVYNLRFRSQNENILENSTYQDDFRTPVELNQKYLRTRYFDRKNHNFKSVQPGPAFHIPDFVLGNSSGKRQHVAFRNGRILASGQNCPKLPPIKGKECTLPDMVKTHRNNLRWREHQFFRVYDVIRERTRAERPVTYKIPHAPGDPVDLPFKYRKACNRAF